MRPIIISRILNELSRQWLPTSGFSLASNLIQHIRPLRAERSLGQCFDISKHFVTDIKISTRYHSSRLRSTISRRARVDRSLDAHQRSLAPVTTKVPRQCTLVRKRLWRPGRVRLTTIHTVMRRQPRTELGIHFPSLIHFLELKLSHFRYSRWLLPHISISIIAITFCQHFRHFVEMSTSSLICLARELPRRRRGRLTPYSHYGRNRQCFRWLRRDVALWLRRNITPFPKGFSCSLLNRSLQGSRFDGITSHLSILFFRHGHQHGPSFDCYYSLIFFILQHCNGIILDRHCRIAGAIHLLVFRRLDFRIIRYSTSRERTRSGGGGTALAPRPDHCCIRGFDTIHT